jgi:hypothetical protein
MQQKKSYHQHKQIQSNNRNKKKGKKGKKDKLTLKLEES